MPDSNPISTINQGMCCVMLLQSCLTLCDPMDCSPPGSSVHEDSPSKKEYWSPSPGDLPNPGIKTRSPVLQADPLPAELPGKPVYSH